MFSSTACEALRTKKRLQLNYDGFNRVVEVHAVGVSTKGNPVTRVWQVRGGSSSENVGWKLLLLNEATGAHVIDETSEAPRRGYKRDDRDMVSIICQI